MKPKALLTLLWLTGIFAPAYARDPQQTAIDSLLKILPGLPDDTNKAMALDKLNNMSVGVCTIMETRFFIVFQ